MGRKKKKEELNTKLNKIKDNERCPRRQMSQWRIFSLIKKTRKSLTPVTLTSTSTSEPPPNQALEEQGKKIIDYRRDQ
jgi:hypothetical protein